MPETPEQRRERYALLKASGLCWRCGKRPQHGDGVYCLPCGEKKTLEGRNRSGCSPRKPGGRGRPAKYQIPGVQS